VHDGGVTITGDCVARRSPLQGSAEAYSGARLERVELTDGRVFVLKHLPANGDWLTRASGGRDRLRQLWVSGVLERVSAIVDHAVVDVFDDDGHDVVVMRDVCNRLLPAQGAVSRATSRQLLAGLVGLHDFGYTESPQELCPVGARYQMFAPHLHAVKDQPGAHPARDAILAGWDVFAEHAPSDVVAAVFAVHEDPAVVSDRLAASPTTLLHGDAKLANLGLGPAGLVAVDWGDLSGFGPAEVDVAWYALMNEARLGVTPDETFADYQALAREPLDSNAIDVACVGSLAQMGFKLAGAAFAGDSPELRNHANASLTWWCNRVRAALERTGIC
jgi:hypothetical protein